MDSQANCYKCKGTYCTNPELQMPVIMRDGTVYCCQCTISEFDRLQAENEAQKITLAHLRKCLKDENESTTKLFNEQYGLQFWLDKICEPAIRDRSTEWSRVGQEITAMESLGNIYLYLDSQKQEQPHPQHFGIGYEIDIENCPICNHKPLEGHLCNNGNVWRKYPKLLCSMCLSGDSKPLHPCPDCAWGQRKVYYCSGRFLSALSGLRGVNDIVAYEPCPTCKGKRVIEDSSHKDT